MSDSAITSSRASVLSLATMKLHLVIDTDLLDTVLQIHLDAARGYVENAISKHLIAHEREARMDNFHGRVMQLVGRPFRKLLSVKYIDFLGVEQTFSLANLIIADDGRIQIKDGITWPLLFDTVDAVRIRYMSGMAQKISVLAGTWTGRDHGLVEDEIVRLWSNGILPAGFETKDYYAVNVTADTFGLSETMGGVQVVETDAGTGDHFVGEIPPGIEQCILWMAGHFYENREATSDLTVTALPLGVEAVLFGEATHT